MIRKLINYILVLMMFLFCLSFKAEAQDTRVFVKLDPATIRIGDQAKLRLTVEQPAKEQVSFPKLGDTLTSKIQVIETGKQDTIKDKNDPSRITVTKSITITSFDAGAYIIPPFVFTAKGGGLKTAESVLTVEAVKVDTTKAIYDIKQPLAVSYSWMDWLRDNWAWVVSPILAILVIAGLIWYLKKRAKDKPVTEVIVPGLPVHVTALNRLQELRAKKLWQQGEIKQYYSELSDVIREYLEKRYAIKTQEKTTDEIFSSLKGLEITPENKQVLHQLLTMSDLVKFAKEKPLPVENEEQLDNAISFVKHTQVVEKPLVIKEGGRTDEHI